MNDPKRTIVPFGLPVNTYPALMRNWYKLVLPGVPVLQASDSQTARRAKRAKSLRSPRKSQVDEKRKASGKVSPRENRRKRVGKARKSQKIPRKADDGTNLRRSTRLDETMGKESSETHLKL